MKPSTWTASVLPSSLLRRAAAALPGRLLPPLMATVAPKFRSPVSSSPTGSTTDYDELDELLKDAEPGVDIAAEGIPPLGEPRRERRFWFQRNIEYNPNAIATQPSVFDDSSIADQYKPPRDWENVHRFDPMARWTWAEETKLVKKIDSRIMIWACVMFMALELDRANLSQALTDNLLGDLGLTTNDYNLGNTIFKFSFLVAELPSQLVSKWVGPDRWIPAQMVLWSIAASFQFVLSGRTSFLISRALLAVLQGGFIPDIVLYLSYFYKHHELSLRLAFFWTAMSLADVVAGFLAYGLLHMRGVQGHAGWRWLFLIEGLITMSVGLLSFLLMPAGPTQTASWFRGKKGWFTEREEVVMVNRVIRDDPSKSDMHNREAITPRLLWQSLKDFDLWPLYILGLLFEVPVTPVSQYMTLTLRNLGFGTFVTNLLNIPHAVFHMITMLLLTYLAEVFGQLSLVALIGQLWAMPLLVYINMVDISAMNKWWAWGVLTLLLSYPNAHAIQVGWNSRNSNSVRSRTMSAALYNMCVQAGGIISSNVYREDDAPRYRRGNRFLLFVVFLNCFLYLFTKAYYVWRNRVREKKWNRLRESAKVEYLSTARSEGSKRLDFRFAS